MKKVTLRRYHSTDQGTVGELVFGDYKRKSLELPWRDNTRRMSCIPTGNYLCNLVNSPKFGRCYNVANVSGRSAILIHSANFAGDTNKGFDTHLHGCIAPFKVLGLLKNSKNVQQLAGLVSRPTLNEFMSWASGDTLVLEIK
jgi:hypothetical protein